MFGFFQEGITLAYCSSQLAFYFGEMGDWDTQELSCETTFVICGYTKINKIKKILEW